MTATVIDNVHHIHFKGVYVYQEAKYPIVFSYTMANIIHEWPKRKLCNPQIVRKQRRRKVRFN